MSYVPERSVSLEEVSPAVSPEEADVPLLSLEVDPPDSVESLLPHAASETVIAATSKAEITFFFILFLSFDEKYLYKMRHCIL
jgi:hypothetical protein